MGRGISAKTKELIATAVEILTAHNPMTLRQLYYQLISRHALENNQSQYDRLGVAVVRARKDGTIPWGWIEDRSRLPRHVDMWNSLDELVSACADAYRGNVWNSQPGYIEVWLEKEALSGIFETELDHYGMTLNVGKGYDGWTSICNAAERFNGWGAATILYFGDFDPSGVHMIKSLGDRLAHFDCHPTIVPCALTKEDIERYNLPPDRTKKADKRAAAFIAEHGDISVELDALPIDVLRARIVEEVESRMDMGRLEQVLKQDVEERQELADRLAGE